VSVFLVRLPKVRAAAVELLLTRRSRRKEEWWATRWKLCCLAITGLSLPVEPGCDGCSGHDEVGGIDGADRGTVLKAAVLEPCGVGNRQSEESVCLHDMVDHTPDPGRETPAPELVLQ